MKATFAHQTRNIVQKMGNELNGRNVGGYLYKAGCIIDKLKAANKKIFSKLQNVSGASNSYDYEEVEITTDFFLMMILGSRRN